MFQMTFINVTKVFQRSDFFSDETNKQKRKPACSLPLMLLI
ncbi:hypothetical protein EMIT079MI2_230035 [Bacillus sp. IT-79MI2]